MAISLSSLWLKSMKRLTKAPRARGQQLVKSAIEKTVRAVVGTVIGVKKRPTTRKRATRSPLSSPAPLLARPGTVVKPVRKLRSLLPAGATWQKAYFSPPETAQISIPRRIAYWLYVPTRPHAGGELSDAPMPLVVMLHGCKQTALDIATATRMNALAERKRFAVLYPHQSSGADTHRCWHWYKRGVQRGEGDVAMIAQMVAQVQKKYAFDVSRTYVAGLSAGAAMATILALRHPDVFAAVGLHSAPVFATSDSTLSAFRTMQQGAPHAHSAVVREFLAEHADFPGMPAMVIHGDDDSVVRRINAEELAQQFLMVNAAALTSKQPTRRLHPGSTSGLKPRLAFHTDTWHAKRKPYVVNCTVNGLGHAWSGGDKAVDYTEPRGPNASLMLWEFFEHHQRVAAEAAAEKL